jgi:hypothetical protein
MVYDNVLLESIGEVTSLHELEAFRSAFENSVKS